jgi:hypothetical protein
MTTNNKISNIISSISPFFVRSDHANFIAFLEAYYEFLEQNENVIDSIKNIKNYRDIDFTLAKFEEHLHSEFLKLIPENIQTDKAVLIKHIKDFYRARGTEKSIKFLLNILFGSEQNAEIYYPKVDILKASSGNWYIEKTLKIDDIKVNNVSNSNIITVQNFKSRKITGNISNASAIVENIDIYYEKGLLVKELKLSGEIDDFIAGETLFTTFDEEGTTKYLTGTLYSGVIATTNIISPGNNYVVGSSIPLENSGGYDGEIIISDVSEGELKTITVLEGGSGYQAESYLLITGGPGTGANGVISSVSANSQFHPNSYNIITSTIELEANTPIGNAVYSNLNPSILDPANDSIANSVSTFTYSNTGPIFAIIINEPGENYIPSPTITPTANSLVKSLGILGRMEIRTGGQNYNIDDVIEFINPAGTHGFAGRGKVTSVNTLNSNTITAIAFTPVGDFITGGYGYSQNNLPIANVISNTGTGANIAVISLLGYGANLTSTSAGVGEILELTIASRGYNYNVAPTLNLTSLGDGTAQANCTIVEGIFTYPGRWLNDDSHLSSYNFLQDRDYYQNYSYVVKVKKSINEYRKVLMDLIHPAGMKLFGEYSFSDESNGSNLRIYSAASTQNTRFFSGTYSANSGNINVTRTSHGIEPGDIIYLEFVTGDTINISNGLFSVISGNANTFYITHGNTTNSSGNVYLGLMQ